MTPQIELTSNWEGCVNAMVVRYLLHFVIAPPAAAPPSERMEAVGTHVAEGYGGRRSHAPSPSTGGRSRQCHVCFWPIATVRGVAANVCYSPVSDQKSKHRDSRGGRSLTAG